MTYSNSSRISSNSCFFLNTIWTQNSHGTFISMILMASVGSFSSSFGRVGMSLPPDAGIDSRAVAANITDEATDGEPRLRRDAEALCCETVVLASVSVFGIKSILLEFISWSGGKEGIGVFLSSTSVLPHSLTRSSVQMPPTATTSQFINHVLFFWHIRHTIKQTTNWMAAPWKNWTSQYDFFSHPSLNGVLFPMFCLLVEGKCQILVF